LLIRDAAWEWFSRDARQHDASFVEAIDIFHTVIEEARKLTNDRQIHDRIADIEFLDLPEQQFDLAFSSLAFHCLRDFDRIVRTVYQSLHGTSSFVFSIEHLFLLHLPARIMLN